VQLAPHRDAPARFADRTIPADYTRVIDNWPAVSGVLPSQQIGIGTMAIVSWLIGSFLTTCNPAML
jgi:hypothetical protein